ncbi:hypothetical protein L208DRAFT_540578 [Tricholoma matsutake]|nr:hypothetical protein L208DRAFT_540578 [Tricholoma matsutake 945]
MHRRMILICLCAQQVALALPADDGLNLPLQAGNETLQGHLCLPFGVCEPCPDEALQEPFCKPFGNRRLLHCVNATAPLSQSHEQTSPDAAPPLRPSASPNHQTLPHPEGEIPAWESCGRIVHQERADFYEFIACNILFAIAALSVLFARSRRLNALQARQLAARIGIIRNGGTGGSGRL